MENSENYAAGVLPDHIKHYKALYKGRRYWVFENSMENPYGDWAYKDFEILVYDRTEHAVIAAGKRREDGLIRGSVMWGQGVDFDAHDARQMVDKVLWIASWYR